MTRNRYYYLTPSIQDTKGKEGHTKRNGTTIKTLQAENQKDSFFLIGQPVILNTNLTRTYMQRHTMTEIVNHSLGTVSKNLTEGLNRFNAATTLALRSAVVYTRHLFSSREGS